MQGGEYATPAIRSKNRARGNHETTDVHRLHFVVQCVVARANRREEWRVAILWCRRRKHALLAILRAGLREQRRTAQQNAAYERQSFHGSPLLCSLNELQAWHI